MLLNVSKSHVSGIGFIKEFLARYNLDIFQCSASSVFFREFPHRDMQLNQFVRDNTFCVDAQVFAYSHHRVQLQFKDNPVLWCCISSYQNKQNPPKAQSYKALLLSSTVLLTVVSKQKLLLCYRNLLIQKKLCLLCNWLQCWIIWNLGLEIQLDCPSVTKWDVVGASS